jgi:hypothetical protein
VSLEVVAQLAGCNEDCVKHLMHLQVPCLCVMEDLTDAVHQALDALDPPRGSDTSTSMGLGPGGAWPPGSDTASGSWDPSASWLSGPETTSRSWDPAALWPTGPKVGCGRKLSEMRGLSPKIISGDSRRSENAQTHIHKHTVPNMKFNLKLLQIKCHVLGFTKGKAQKVLQRIIRVFAEAFVCHDRHTLFA